MQFFRQLLERAGNFRDFLLPVFARRARLHQLQIIHHHHAKPFFHFEPLGFGAHFQYRNRGRVININRGFRENFGRMRQALPIVGFQIADPHALRIKAGFAAQQADAQLLFRHFKAEHRRRNLLFDADMLRDIEAERRFPHRRPRRENNQIRRLKPGRHAIQFDESGRNARHEAFLLRKLLDFLIAVLHDDAERRERLFNLAFGDFENLLLRRF